jgi:hypothetical protein
VFLVEGVRGWGGLIGLSFRFKIINERSAGEKKKLCVGC